MQFFDFGGDLFDEGIIRSYGPVAYDERLDIQVEDLRQETGDVFAHEPEMADLLAPQGGDGLERVAVEYGDRLEFFLRHEGQFRDGRSVEPDGPQLSETFEGNPLTRRECQYLEIFHFADFGGIFQSAASGQGEDFDVSRILQFQFGHARVLEEQDGDRGRDERRVGKVGECDVQHAQWQQFLQAVFRGIGKKSELGKL